MRNRSGFALKHALLLHRTARSYRSTHRGKSTLVGYLKAQDDGIYLLLLREEPHFYIKRQSLGMDSSIFADAVKRGARSVVIAYTGRGGNVTVYRAPIERWKNRGFEISYPDFDSQIQLPVRLMEIVERD